LTFKTKKTSLASVIFMFIFISLIAGGGFVFFSPMFEKNKPTIDIQNNIFWNLHSKLSIKLSDDSGIKFYKIIFKDGNKEIVLAQEILPIPSKQLDLQIDPPKLDMFYKKDKAIIQVQVVDNSKWNYMNGNIAIKNINVKIDKKKPTANIVNNSRYIQRGGSAIVVVQVKDKNLKEAYISFNNKIKFKLTPYLKESYFVALIAWPIDIKKFKRVNLVAIDKANNQTVTKVPLYIQNARLKKDNIKLSENFIKNVSTNVLEQSNMQVPQTLEEIFIYSNKELRAKNLKTIKEVGDKAIDTTSIIDSFNIKRFRRLRGSKTVASYGERRSYYLDGKKINEAWHLGIDMASIKHAPIKISNDGVVVYKNYLGLYGNAIIVKHSLGLCSLYAHTSTQNVELGDSVTAGQKIANTGSTGGVFGDHLHFGIIVQGYEVNPLEWMDSHWIKGRITKVLKNAKKQILSK